MGCVCVCVFVCVIQWNTIQPWEKWKYCNLWEHESWGHYAKWDMSDRKWQILYDIPYVVTKKQTQKTEWNGGSQGLGMRE